LSQVESGPDVVFRFSSGPPEFPPRTRSQLLGFGQVR
jgi:hypothetical protein